MFIFIWNQNFYVSSEFACNYFIVIKEVGFRPNGAMLRVRNEGSAYFKAKPNDEWESIRYFNSSGNIVWV